MNRYINSRVILVFILLLAVILRFWHLGEVPHSINGDQLHYLFNAESFLYTGLDATQTKSLADIFMFRYPAGDAVQAELPYVLSIITVGVFSNTLFNAFFVYALLGVLVVVMIYLITKELLNEQAALMASFIAAVNPWFIFISRTAYEMIPATFFWLCFVYCLLIFKGWKIFISFIFFVLAFYSYIGTKLIALPLAVLIVLYVYLYKNKKKYFKQYLIFISLVAVFVGFFVFQLFNASGSSRVTDFINPNDPIYANTVDAIRKNSIQNPFLFLFENKLTIFMMVMLSNFMNIINPSYLFINGDYFMSLGKFGIFNPLDIILFILGSLLLFKYNKKLLVLLYLLILLSFIPQIVHKNSNAFTPHIMLAIPFFIILFSASILLVKKFNKNLLFLILAAVFMMGYLFNTGKFMHTYFYRMPLQNDFFNFPNRVLSEYIHIADKNDRNIIVFSNNSRDLYREYIFYNDIYSKKTASDIADSLLRRNYEIENVSFKSCNELFKNDSKTLIIVKNQCDMSLGGSYLSISNLSDGGWVYRIYNDPICKKYNLFRYSRSIALNDFSINNMDQKKFCEKFITDPRL